MPLDPENINSGIKTMTTGYTKSVSNIFDRPLETEFSVGSFVEDYRYDGQSGDLDRNNGRFAKTKEFPNGVYAYHATVNETTKKPEFPYFGDTFRSNTIEENRELNQKFDFNNSSLSRNTLPYKISELNADNDFIIESNEIKRQKFLLNLLQGSVSSIQVIASGENYKVNDSLVFGNTDTNGGGLSVSISSLKGKTINNIDTTEESDSCSCLEKWWKVEVTTDSDNTFSDIDYITIDSIIQNYSSGESSAVDSKSSKLNGYFKIKVQSIPNIGLTTAISETVGASSTEIYVTNIPSGVKVDSSTNIGIGTETLKVLNIYPDKNIIRVEEEFLILNMLLERQ